MACIEDKMNSDADLSLWLRGALNRLASKFGVIL